MGLWDFLVFVGFCESLAASLFFPSTKGLAVEGMLCYFTCNWDMLYKRTAFTLGFLAPSLKLARCLVVFSCIGLEFICLSLWPCQSSAPWNIWHTSWISSRQRSVPSLGIGRLRAPSHHIVRSKLAPGLSFALCTNSKMLSSLHIQTSGWESSLWETTARKAPTRCYPSAKLAAPKWAVPAPWGVIPCFRLRVSALRYCLVLSELFQRCHALNVFCLPSWPSSLKAPIAFILCLLTCLSNPCCVKSTIPTMSLAAFTSSPVCRCFVMTSAGFISPVTFPMIARFVFTSSCTYRCAMSMCRILPTPIFLAACNAALESHQIRGVTMLMPKSVSAKFLTKTEVLAHSFNALISASPELVAGVPCWVCDPDSTTVPARKGKPLRLCRLSSLHLQPNRNRNMHATDRTSDSLHLPPWCCAHTPGSLSNNDPISSNSENHSLEDHVLPILWHWTWCLHDLVTNTCYCLHN